MTPDELRQASILLFGERGWMSRLSEALGVDRSTVSRWFAGLPVPGPAAAAVQAWLELYRLTGKRPLGLNAASGPPANPAGGPLAARKPGRAG